MAGLADRQAARCPRQMPAFDRVARSEIGPMMR
jgi:hypothetical protein